MDKPERNAKGQFPKGVSGNPRGRKEGVKNKPMTNKQVTDYLGKRLEHYFIRIEDLANSVYHPYIAEGVDKDGEPQLKPNPTYDPKLSFSIYSKLIDEQTKAKQVEDKKKKMSGNKSGGKKEEVKEDEPDMSSVVSGNFRK
jgi:hypothetical protein